MVDPFVAIPLSAKLATGLIGSALGLQDLADQTKANKRQCQLLSRRIAAVAALVQGMLDRHQDNPEALDSVVGVLTDLSETVARAQELMSDFASENKWHRRLLTTGSFRSAFADINERLTGLLQLLDTTINVNELFNKDEDQAAEDADLKAIQSSLDLIVELHIGDQQLLSAIYQRQEDLARNVAQSVKEHLVTHVASTTTPPRDRYEHLEIPFWRLCFEEQIGRGGFGVVYKGTYQGEPVAIKQLDVDRLGPVALKEFKNEIDVLSRITSRYIPRLYGICTEQGRYCIVMEFMPRGNLSEVLRDPDLELPWGLRYRMALESARAMQLLYANGIQHRDFKSLNVLLDEYLHCKVSDFGLSKCKTSMLTSTNRTGGSIMGSNDKPVVTLAWTAPERLRAGSRFTDKSDVYSFGVTMFEIASRELPFAGEDALIVRMSILEGARPELPEETPPEFVKLIEECWAQDPKVRPGFEEIVRRLELMHNAAMAEEQATETVRMGRDPIRAYTAASMSQSKPVSRSLSRNGSRFDSAHFTMTGPVGSPPLPPLPIDIPPSPHIDTMQELGASISGLPYSMSPPQPRAMSRHLSQHSSHSNGYHGSPPASSHSTPSASLARSPSASRPVDLHHALPSSPRIAPTAHGATSPSTVLNGHHGRDSVDAMFAREKAAIRSAMEARTGTHPPSHAPLQSSPAVKPITIPTTSSSVSAGSSASSSSTQAVRQTSMHSLQTYSTWSSDAGSALDRRLQRTTDSMSSLSLSSTDGESFTAPDHHLPTSDQPLAASLSSAAALAADPEPAFRSPKSPTTPELATAILNAAGINTRGSPTLYPPSGSVLTIEIPPIAPGPRVLAMEKNSQIHPLPTPAAIYERGYLWATPVSDTPEEGFVPLYSVRTMECEREVGSFTVHTQPIVAHAMDAPDGEHHPVFVASTGGHVQYFSLPECEFERPLALDGSSAGMGLGTRGVLGASTANRDANPSLGSLLSGWNKGGFGMGYIPRMASLYFVGGGKGQKHGVTQLNVQTLMLSPIRTPMQSHEWNVPSVVHAENTLLIGGGGNSGRRFVQFDPRSSAVVTRLPKWTHPAPNKRTVVTRLVYEPTSQCVYKIPVGCSVEVALNHAEVFDMRAFRWIALSERAPRLVQKGGPGMQIMTGRMLRGFTLRKLYGSDLQSMERALCLDTVVDPAYDAVASRHNSNFASTATAAFARLSSHTIANDRSVGVAPITIDVASSPSTPSPAAAAAMTKVEEAFTMWDMTRDVIIRHQEMPSTLAQVDGQVLLAHTPYSGFVSVGRSHVSGDVFVQRHRFGPPLSTVGPNE